MRAFITQPGDPSVGLPDAHATLEFDIPLEEEYREATRQSLTKWMEENIYGEKCIVFFEDECSCCGALLIEGKCPNLEFCEEFG